MTQKLAAHKRTFPETILFPYLIAGHHVLLKRQPVSLTAAATGHMQDAVDFEGFWWVDVGDYLPSVMQHNQARHAEAKSAVTFYLNSLIFT